MDGENNGKPNFQMDDLGGFPMIFENTHISTKKTHPQNLAAKWLHSQCQDGFEAETFT